MSTSAVLTARSESELVATLSANAGKLCVCFIYQSSVASNVAHADTFSRIAAELAGDAVFIKVGTGGPEGSLGHNQLIELAQRRRFKTTPTTLLYLANELKASIDGLSESRCAELRSEISKHKVVKLPQLSAEEMRSLRLAALEARGGNASGGASLAAAVVIAAPKPAQPAPAPPPVQRWTVPAPIAVEDSTKRPVLSSPADALSPATPLSSGLTQSSGPATETALVYICTPAFDVLKAMLPDTDERILMRALSHTWNGRSIEMALDWLETSRERIPLPERALPRPGRELNAIAVECDKFFEELEGAMLQTATSETRDALSIISTVLLNSLSKPDEKFRKVPIWSAGSPPVQSKVFKSLRSLPFVGKHFAGTTNGSRLGDKFPAVRLFERLGWKVFGDEFDGAASLGSELPYILYTPDPSLVDNAYDVIAHIAMLRNRELKQRM